MLDEDVSLEKILLFLLQESLKFKMLVYLLEHQQVSIVRLATAFNISESSVFRKIKELNQLLEEFGLQIKTVNYTEKSYRYDIFIMNYSNISGRSATAFLQNTPEKKTVHSRIGPCIRNNVYGISRSTDCLLARDYEKRLLNEKVRTQL